MYVKFNFIYVSFIRVNFRESWLLFFYAFTVNCSLVDFRETRSRIFVSGDVFLKRQMWPMYA